MDGKRKININDAPKAFKLLLMLLPVVGIFAIGTELNNDFYFLYPTGEYIVNNGFPVKDFLSMHGNMNIIVQQWATDVVFYALYSRLGKVGLLAFVYLCYLLFAFFMYKLCKLICDNDFIAAVSAFTADIIIAGIYITTRPQAISYLLFVIELFALESYVKTKKPLYLIALPLISLLLINFHASMWLMMFVFALPYAAAALPVKLKKIKQEPCCSFIALLITGVICFAVGFINPYGFKAMTYIFTSFGYSEINNYIYEMAATSVKSIVGIIFYAVIGIMFAIIAITRKNSFSTRFVLMFVGSAVLAVMNVKSVGYFILLGIPAFAYYLKDAKIELTVDDGEKKTTKKQKLEIALLAVLLVGAAAFAVVYMQSPVTQEAPAQKVYSTTEALDLITEDMKKDSDITLYAGFGIGQYLEFKGYHPYIDGRAELFLKDNNGEYDYMKEYSASANGTVYYKDFVNRYDFTHLIISSVEGALYSGIANDGDYVLINEYTTPGGKLYYFKKTA